MYFVSLFSFILCLLGALATPQSSTEQEIGSNGNGNPRVNANVNGDDVNGETIASLDPETSPEIAPGTRPETRPDIVPEPEGDGPVPGETSNPRGEGSVVLPEDSAFPQFGQNEVSPELLRDFVLYREFSAITFCPENNDSPGGPLSTAPADTVDGCPRIASTLSHMNTVLEFEKYEPVPQL